MNIKFVFIHFLKFHKDGKIHKDEFFGYYSKVSACVLDDVQFETIVKNIWKVNRTNTSSSSSSSFRSNGNNNMNNNNNRGGFNGVGTGSGSGSGLPSLEKFDRKESKTTTATAAATTAPFNELPRDRMAEAKLDRSFDLPESFTSE